MTALGTLVGDRYRLDRVVGLGGSATVYQALDTGIGRQVAVKVFSDATDDPAAGFRQASELRVLARLAHPGLVTLFDGDVSGRPEHRYLVLELVEGDTLRQLLFPGPLDRRTVLELGAEVAEALAYVHGRGLVHRDVKPGNILVTQAGAAKLTDFGIVQEAERTRLTEAGTTVGTAAYLSPEQVSGAPVTGASDVYSLGLVLLEALTGERSYDGPAVEAALQRLTRQPAVPVSLGPALGDLLRRMTALRPGDRPSAGGAAAALRGLSDAPPVPTATLPLPAAATVAVPLLPPVPRPRGRRRAALAGAATTGAGLAAVAVLAATGVLGSAAAAQQQQPVRPPATSVSPAATPSATAPAPSRSSPAATLARATIPPRAPKPAAPSGKEHKGHRGHGHG